VTFRDVSGQSQRHVPLQQVQKDQALGEMKESLRYVLPFGCTGECCAERIDRRQIACADIVLINKVDFAKAVNLNHLGSLIRSVNPVAPVVRTVKGQIDLAKILDLKAYSSRPEFAKDPTGERKGEHEDHIHGDHCSHLNDITSLLIPLPPLGQAQIERLDEWIRTILWEGRLLGREGQGGDMVVEVLRCKGIWWTLDGKGFVLQGVRSLYETQEQQNVDQGAAATKDGKIVLIGKGLTDHVSNSLMGFLQIDKYRLAKRKALNASICLSARECCRPFEQGCSLGRRLYDYLDVLFRLFLV